MVRHRHIILTVLTLCLGILPMLGAGSSLAPRDARAQTPAPIALPTSPLAIQSSDGKTYRFKVEIAAKPEERAQGLMYRRTLAADAGMLFDFGQTAPVAMWMKNTLIPLDMLFVAADGVIVNIAQRTVPHSLTAIPSAQPVRFVLEVPGGTTARLGIKPGDKLIHPLFAAPAAP